MLLMNCVMKGGELHNAWSEWAGSDVSRIRSTAQPFKTFGRIHNYPPAAMPGTRRRQEGACEYAGKRRHQQAHI